MGDLVAGITVGAVVVPQSMAYARLAQLPVQYGLYSSFGKLLFRNYNHLLMTCCLVGVVAYWFFATSKDITIGPVAVMSTLVSRKLLRKKFDRSESHPTFRSVTSLREP